MAENLTTLGAEFMIKTFFTTEATKPSSVAIGLYDDATDGLSESSDMGAITTEPTDGNYARLTYSFGTTDYSSGQNADSDWQAQFASKTFDLANTTGSADSYFIVANFTAGSDSSAADHLFAFGPLLDSQGSQMALDLGAVSSFDFAGNITIP